MTRTEAAWLRWTDIDIDIDIESRTIAVRRSRVLVDGRVIEKGTKSERGTRVLPVPKIGKGKEDTITTALTALQAAQMGELSAAGAAYENSGYVVADEIGRPLHPERYSDEFARLCHQAGVPVIRLHDARHTINSLLAAAGVPSHIRASWCGQTVAVNEGTYTHARPEDLNVAGSAIGDIFRALPS